MSVTIKSEREIELIRKSCHIIAKDSSGSWQRAEGWYVYPGG